MSGGRRPQDTGTGSVATATVLPTYKRVYGAFKKGHKKTLREKQAQSNAATKRVPSMPKFSWDDEGAK